MTKPIPLLRMSALFPFINFLEKVGTPIEAALRNSKIPTRSLENPDTFIPRYQVFDFVERVAHQESIPDLGILVGIQTPFKSFGFFDRFIPQAQTLRDAIFLTIQAMKMFSTGDSYDLVEQDKQAWFCQKYYDLKGQDSYSASHFSLILMLDLIQGAVGKDWFPNVIYLQSHRFKIIDHPLSQSRIYTGQEQTAISFPRTFLDLPYLNSNIHSHRRSQPEINHSQISIPSLNFIESLQQAIAPHLKEGYPSINLAAEVAQTSVRTLQRHLNKKGFSYSRMITNLRHQKAINLLENPDLKIIDIASELGYTDPAHFSRAFKCWTGKCPKEFR